MQKLIDVLRANGIAIVPDFTQAKQRSGSQFLFTQTFTIGEKTVTKVIFGDFKTDNIGSWLSDDNLSPDELKAFGEEQQKRSEEFENFKKEQWAITKEEAKAFLQTCSDRGSTDYLDRKKIGLNGALIKAHEKTGSLIVYVPMQDTSGEVWNYQRIFPVKIGEDKKDKFFLKLGRIEGLFHPFGFDPATEIPFEIYIAEGFATAASIYQTLLKPTVCAFNSYNLTNVAGALRAKFPAARLIICADNDQWTTRKTRGGGEEVPYNTGLEAAKYAAKTVGGEIRYPTFKNTSTRLTDFNDLYLLEGETEVRYQLSNAKPLPATQIVNDPQKPVLKKPNEILLSRELFSRYTGRVIKQERDFFLYTGTHWEYGGESQRGAIRNEIRKLSNLMYASREVNSAFSTFFDLIPSVPLGSSMFAGNPMAANFKNGTLHLKRTADHTYETHFTKHNPLDLITNVLPFNYTPDSTEENGAFLEMLERIWKDEPDREDKIRLYGQVMGACLLGAFPMIVLFIGLPGSGKSTLLKLAARLVDQENLCFVDPVHFEGFNMETMVNKLVNVVTDLNTRRPIADEVVKQIVDRQKIRFRRKGIKDIEGYLPPLHLWAANEFPKSLEGAVGSYERRAIILRTEKFQVKSLDTYHKDFPEWVWDQSPQGIINFAVRGAMDLIGRRGHYTVPESSRGEMQKWSHESDPVGVFLAEVRDGSLLVEDTQVIARKEGQFNGPRVWELFKAWYEQDFNSVSRIRKNQFYDRLKKEGFVESRTESQRFWLGMDVIPMRGAMK